MKDNKANSPHLTSHQFQSLPPQTIRQFLNGQAPLKIARRVMDAVICSADLWTLRLMKQELKRK